MSPPIWGLLGIVVFLLLVALEMPIGFAFVLVGFTGLIFLKGLGPGLALLGSAPYAWGSKQALVCLPLFILMGQFAFQSGISRDLYDTAYKWIGRFHGGLALATMAACTGFAACTGSQIASSAAMATISVPEMRRFHYSPKLATSTVAVGGTLGILIPPSTVLIIYGALTLTSIGKLFIAGIFPGLLLSFLYLTVIFLMCKRDPKMGPAGPSFPWRERFAALSGTWAMLALFLMVMSGLYFGIFTPSEAGAGGAFGAFLVVLIRRRMTVASFIASLRDSLRVSCFTMILFLGAMIFNVFLTVSCLPQVLVEWITTSAFSTYAILILILLMHVPLGMVMSGLPMLLLTLPIVFPVILSLGIDPIWFGILAVIMVEGGAVTPPVGMTVYVVQGVVRDVSVGDIFQGVMPFLIAMAIGVAILIAFPQISLFLPTMME